MKGNTVSEHILSTRQILAGITAGGALAAALVTGVPHAQAAALFVPGTADNRAAAHAAIIDVYYREAAPGGDIPLSHFVEAISGVAAEYNHTITSPVVTSGTMLQAGGFDRLLVPGAITFTDA